MTAVRSSSIGAAASGTAVTVSAPAGTTAGDLVIVVVHCNANTTIVDNNGATPFTEDLNDYQNVGAGQTGSIFSRRIVAGDPPTYAFTLGTSTRWTAVAITFSGPDPSAIYDVAPTVGNSARDTGNPSFASLDITTLTNGAFHLIYGLPDGNSQSASATPPGYTVEQNGGNQGIAAAWKVISPAGATGAQTWTWTVSTPSITFSFAVKAAAVSAADGAGRPYWFD